MKVSADNKAIQLAKVEEDFNWGATIAVMVVLLMFLSAIMYVLVSSLNTY